MDSVSTRAKVCLLGVAVVAAITLALNVSMPVLANTSSQSCPVIYHYSRHTCYAAPSHYDVSLAQRQFPRHLVGPVRIVRHFTSLRLTSIVVDRTSRSRSGGQKPHVWVIDYVFGRAPDVGLHIPVVGRSDRFLIGGEAVGRIAGRQFDTPQFWHNPHQPAIWAMSVNLPGRQVALEFQSTLPKAALEHLAQALMRRARATD
jgi:hypothetical protein